MARGSSTRTSSAKLTPTITMGPMKLAEAREILSLTLKGSVYARLKESLQGILVKNNYKGKRSGNIGIWKTYRDQWVKDNPELCHVIKTTDSAIEAAKKRKAIDIICSDIMHRYVEHHVRRVSSNTGSSTTSRNTPTSTNGNRLGDPSTSLSNNEIDPDPSRMSRAIIHRRRQMARAKGIPYAWQDWESDRYLDHICEDMQKGDYEAGRYPSCPSLTINNGNQSDVLSTVWPRKGWVTDGPCYILETPLLVKPLPAKLSSHNMWTCKHKFDQEGKQVLAVKQARAEDYTQHGACGQSSTQYDRHNNPVLGSSHKQLYQYGVSDNMDMTGHAHEPNPNIPGRAFVSLKSGPDGSDSAYDCTNDYASAHIHDQDIGLQSGTLGKTTTDLSTKDAPFGPFLRPRDSTAHSTEQYSHHATSLATFPGSSMTRGPITPVSPSSSLSTRQASGLSTEQVVSSTAPVEADQLTGGYYALLTAEIDQVKQNSLENSTQQMSPYGEEDLLATSTSPYYLRR